MATIGVITFHESANYGAVLQAYALQKCLADMGHNAEIIDYCSPRMGIGSLSGIRRVRHFVWHKIAKPVLVGSVREQRTQGFRSKYFRLSPVRYVDPKALHLDPPQYDAYITGSDQVWNPTIHGGDSSYFLTFAPEGKTRISYAASFGISLIPQSYASDYSQWLEQIHYLSTRELEGAEVVKRLAKRDAVIALDPTLLFDREHWREVAVSHELDRPYVLCYYMPGDRAVCRRIAELARQVSMATGWRVISIGEKEYTRLSPWKYSVFNAGPAEFLGLCQGASFIITNSFHGTAFSINYRKPFLVPINQGRCPERTLNSRITSLLRILRLEERLVPVGRNISADNVLNMDFAVAESILEQERRKSLDFLRGSLGGA